MDVAAPRRTGFPTEDGRDSLVNAQADIGLRIRGNVQHSRTQKNIRGKLYGVVLFPIDDAGGGSGKLAEDLRDDLPPLLHIRVRLRRSMQGRRKNRK